MSDENLHQGDKAATDLTAEERIGLIPTWIVTRDDLNRAERANIAAGLIWVRRRRGFNVLTPPDLLRLHARLFGDVWRWAGAPRESEKNIGPADWWTIPERLDRMTGDIAVQVQAGARAPDEIAVEFHHRLVALHVFPNGNGRHGRISADLLAEQHGVVRRSAGGRRNLVDAGRRTPRRLHVAALKAADAHDLAPLLAFARS